ncbi:hypothetical protein AYO41_00310 [Verrucomicrobia bacterium SCGC AG-212-E04]|nr:hypothetical protein AYO41_00310 [Verrucomicrobia bacterium SCGC AG-212-E04]
MRVCLGLLLLAGVTPAACSREPVPGEPLRFDSPDGSRSVRLCLVGLDPKADLPGMDKSLAETARKAGPSLSLEYTMLLGSNEVIIRSFTSSQGDSNSARYRVLWDEQGSKFVVLCDTAPKPAGRKGKLPERWPTGEYVVFFFDRETEIHPPSEGFSPQAWAGTPTKGPDKGSVPPVVLIDMFRTTGKSERVGKTGEMKPGRGRLPSNERITNFIIHSNTQRLRKTPQDPHFKLPADILNARSPDGRFQARLMGGEANTVSPAVLLAEGDAFRDQLWVLNYPFRRNPPLAPGKSGPQARFVWSKDSRYLLLLTRDSAERGLTRLENGEELYLLFDTTRWEGIIAPERKEIEGIEFGL